MAYFSSSSNANQVYAVSSDTLMDGALDKSLQLQPFLCDLQQQGLVADIQSCSQFLCSKAEQAQRLALWHSFIERHGSVLESSVKDAARREGFAQGTFDDFFRLLHTPYGQQAANYFAPLTSTIFTSNLTADSIHRKYNVISVLKVAPDHINDVVSRIDNASLGSYAFDVTSMNSSIATRLSDDFNYIGWACGLIVFFFLWFSLGSFELALLSFLPMAISWIWILGMMALLDIQFNVVNIILATFIFGQGDDYTIFMTALSTSHLQLAGKGSTRLPTAPHHLENASRFQARQRSYQHRQRPLSLQGSRNLHCRQKEPRPRHRATRNSRTY